MADTFLAIDMGASSGRVMAGILNDGKLSLEEIHRFDNGPVEKDGSLYWDIDNIFSELRIGIKKAAALHPEAKSIGIDTWGIDYVILKPDGSFARAPFNYRDSRTDGMPEKIFRIIPEKELYARTGIQRLQFNTLYQLVAHKEKYPEDFAEGNTMLLIPDAVAFWLCGDISCEYTNATTTNLLNASSREWDWETIDALGLPRFFFPKLTPPSTVVGKLRKELADEFGIEQLEVCKVGSHDTASAVAAVPAPRNQAWNYISCGTWALFGAELDKPVLTEEAFKVAFTNEGGICGKIRFLTNIIGMWLAQELRADWSAQKGEKIPWKVVDTMAIESPGLKFIINPNAREFLSPGDMAGKIRRFCERTGQGTPTDAETIRAVYDSLALCFREKMEKLSDFSGQNCRCLNIVGGGSNAKVLMRIVADICNVDVIAGPVEATTTGNILSQAIARGMIGSLDEARDVVRASFTPVVYSVEDHDRAKYDVAYAKFCELAGK